MNFYAALAQYYEEIFPDQFSLLLKEAGFGEVGLYGNWNREALTGRQLPLMTEASKAFQ